MHECKVAQSCLTLFDPLDCNLPGSSVHGILHGKKTGVGCHALLQGIFLTQGSDPGIRPVPPASQAGSLPTEPSGNAPNMMGLALTKK